MAERDIVKLDEFPSNSFSSKEKKPKKKTSEEDSDKKVKKVVKKKAVRHKKSIGDRLSEAFLGDSSKNVGEYVLWDVLIPAAKNTLSDMVTTGIEMILFGDSRGDRRNRTVRDRGRSYVSYQSYYDDDRRERRPRRTNRKACDDVILDSRQEAEDVLSGMADIIDEYGAASASDLYELSGVDWDYTDQKWGWDNVSAAYVERRRDGYLLRMPRPILID